MKPRPNLKNFSYLVGSGLIIQLAGTIYRIWLARSIGPEGLGILQMIYPVYRLLSGVACIGLPLALTKWVSEYLASHDHLKITYLKNWAFRTVLVSSVVIGLLLYNSAPILSHQVFTDPRVGEALLVIALAIPFSALSAIFRGYFQGYSRMAPTAASEIMEQVVEISTTVLLTIFLARMLPFHSYTYPVIGLTMGEVACLLTLLVFLKRNGVCPKYPADSAAVPRYDIFRYSWPLLLNQVVVSISLASEGIIIPHLLISGGCPAALSTGLFGKLTGMAEPVAYFPLIFLAPLGTVLSPQISAAYKTKSLDRMKQKISLFYLVSTFLCIASFYIIYFQATPLTRFLYNNTSAALLTKLLVIGLPFTAFAILNISILAAIGATRKILLLSLWSVGLKTFSLIVLTPFLGIEGSAWAINVTQIFIGLASMVEVWQFLPKPGA
jgi:stage V sporulation protein B